MSHRRLSDREMFCARPWRAPDRAQVIFAVVATTDTGRPAGQDLVIATLHGSAMHVWPLSSPRPAASFTESELLEYYNAAMEAVPGPQRALA